MLPDELRNLSEEALVANLLQRNQVPVEDILRAKKNPSQSILFLRLKAKSFSVLRKASYLGFSRCRTFQSTKVLRCYHCQALGHVSTHCTRPLKCSKCAEDGHTADQCTSIDQKCALCNSKDHLCHDMKACPRLVKAQQQLIERTHHE